MAGLKKGEAPKGRMPRIYASIKPTTFDMIKDITKRTGQSNSAFVSEMVEAAVPTMLQMRETLIKLESMEEDQKAAVMKQIEQTEGILNDAMASAGQIGLLDSLGRRS